MKFKDFYKLALSEEIEFDMSVGGEDILCTIAPVNLTPYGEVVFDKLLRADIELIVPPPAVAAGHTPVVCIDEDLYKLGNFFAHAMAGYCAEPLYDRLFTLGEPYPTVRVVAQKLFKQLLSLGGYRYAVQIDGTTEGIIYAWNDGEAMKLTGFQPETAVI